MNCTCDQRTDVASTRFIFSISIWKTNPLSFHFISLSADLSAPRESSTSPLNLHVYSKKVCEICFRSFIYKMSILSISEWRLIECLKAKCHCVFADFSKQL